MRQRITWSITENTPGIGLEDSIADVESVVIQYQIPRRTEVALQRGDQFFVALATVVPADIDVGTVRAYKTNPTGTYRIKFFEGPIARISGLVGGSEDVYRLKAGMAFHSDEILQITFEGADVADAGETQVFIEGIAITS